MMRLHSVTLILENCDSITINKKHIRHLDIYGIKTGVFLDEDNKLRERIGADSIAIMIHKEANQPRKPFEVEDYDDVLVFDEIVKGNNITSVIVCSSEFIDGISTAKREEYMAPWVEYKQGYNTAQKNRISQEGNLYIIIDENQDIDSYYESLYLFDKRWGK